MDEKDLIREAQLGHLDAFNRLVLAYQDSIYNAACRLVSDEDLAADATQMTFISAFHHIKNFRGGSFRAWLLKIVTNKCYDELRRHKRHPTISLEPVNSYNEDEIDTSRWLSDNAPSPEQQTEIEELDHAIQHCLNNLPEDFRLIVVMVDLEGLDYQEASTIIQTPLGTIKSRLSRARLRLQECLQQFWELLPSQFRLVNEKK